MRTGGAGSYFVLAFYGKYTESLEPEVMQMRITINEESQKWQLGGAFPANTKGYDSVVDLIDFLIEKGCECQTMSGKHAYIRLKPTFS